MSNDKLLDPTEEAMASIQLLTNKELLEKAKEPEKQGLDQFEAENVRIRGTSLITN
jgi:hypothetical protein